MNIRSVAEYYRIVTKLNLKYADGSTSCFLYRGYSNHKKYKLLPGILRTISDDNEHYIRPYNQDEKSVLQEYKDGLPNVDVDDKRLSELAQHYQAPTRHLDFTEDPYVALYFACETMPEKNDYPSVWVFNRVNYSDFFYANERSIDRSWDSDAIVDKIYNDEISNKTKVFHNDPELCVIRPYIYKPEEHDLRIVNQKSWFLMWGAKEETLDTVVNLNYKNVISTNESVVPSVDQMLGVITIDPEYRCEIRSKLSDMGYNYDYIYPTLPNHGRQVSSNNYNERNSQYTEHRNGGVMLTFKDPYPSREKW